MLKMAKLFLLLVVAVVGAFANSSNRVFGGYDAPDGAFPYMVSLRDPGGYHNCGGSIIDRKTILTAAHCISGSLDKPYEIGVVAGANKLDAAGVRYQVKSLSIPPSGDIGVIVLENPIEFTDNIRPITLETEENDEERDCVFSGWGLTESGESPNNLQYIILKTLSNSDCKNKMAIGDEDICTFTKVGEGICFGDSGSALVAGGRQIGVASRVVPCAVGSPDVFTRVSYFKDWINQNRG